MDEKNVSGQEFTDDSWGDEAIDLSDVVDEPFTDEPEENTGTQPEGEAEADQSGAEPKAAGVEEPNDKVKADQSFDIHYMGETRRVSAEEYAALAQKGVDYDRIRSKYDEFQAGKPMADMAVSFLNELAKSQGVAPEELVTQTRANIIAQRDGLSQDEAVRRVKLEDRERALAERESRLKDTDERAAAAKREAERRQRDISEFTAAYPELKPKDIPQEVWDMVKTGASLLSAYTRHENKRLKDQLEAELKNQENAKKSAGSRATAASKPAEDIYDKYWYD